MVLNLLTSFVYDLVQQSWLVSTVLLKYVLLFIGADTLYREGPDLEYFETVVMESSRELVTVIVLLGLVNVYLGFPVEPLLQIPSQLIALAFFGYLFWKY